MEKNCLNCHLYMKKIDNVKSFEVVYACNPIMSLGIKKDRLQSYSCNKGIWEKNIPRFFDEIFPGLKGRRKRC